MSLVFKITKFYIYSQHLRVLVYSNEVTKAQKGCIEWPEWPTDLGKCQTQYPHQWWFPPFHAAYRAISLPGVKRSTSESMGDSWSYRSPLRQLTSADVMTREQKLQHISESHQKMTITLGCFWFCFVFWKINYYFYFLITSFIFLSTTEMLIAGLGRARFMSSMHQ